MNPPSEGGKLKNVIILKTVEKHFRELLDFVGRLYIPIRQSEGAWLEESKVLIADAISYENFVKLKDYLKRKENQKTYRGTIRSGFTIRSTWTSWSVLFQVRALISG